MSDRSLSALRAGYDADWSRMTIRPECAAAAMKKARLIAAGKQRFLTVEKATTVPWFVVGLLLLRESDLSFSGHLHNGDSLKNRTKHVPAGRPLQPDPPYTWEVSAIDAVRYDDLHRIGVWDVAAVAWAAERFNGFGYRGAGIRSPYLWSWTNNQLIGKYTDDGKLDRGHWDEQPGVMAILSALIQIGEVPSFAGGRTYIAPAGQITHADGVAAQAAPKQDAAATVSASTVTGAGVAAAGWSPIAIVAAIVGVIVIIAFITLWLRRRRAGAVAETIVAAAAVPVEPRTIDHHTGEALPPIA